MLCEVGSICRESLGLVVRIQVVKCIQDESTVGVDEIELDYHRPLCLGGLLIMAVKA